MDTPAAVGDASDFLDVDVDHVAGPAGDDRLGHPVGLSVGVDESAAIEYQGGQVPRHGAPTDAHAELAELEGNPCRRPFALAAHRFDLGDDLGAGGGGLVPWSRRPVLQAQFTELTETVDPLRRAGPRDAHLGGDMRDRTMSTTGDTTTAAFNRQRSITVSHGRVPSPGGTRGLAISHPAAEGPVLLTSRPWRCLQRHDPQQLTVSRPDVAAVYGSSSLVGFWKAIGTVGLPPAFTIGVRVVFQDGRAGARSRKSRHAAANLGVHPPMQPIMVTSPGRSGSTLLMRMLAEHPDIIVHERFPYETNVCSYWMHFMRVLAAPADTSPVESLQFWRDPKRLLPFPYFFKEPAIGLTAREEATLDRWYATDQVEEFARVAQVAVESFYRQYASRRKRTTPAFFAEKIVPVGSTFRPIMRLLYPRVREIFLIRDPRDTLGSVLAFNAQRGFDGFGR